jgi:hypothetical protein
VLTVVVALIGIYAIRKWCKKKKATKQRQQQAIRDYPPEYDEIYGTQPLNTQPTAPAYTQSNQTLNV